LLQQFLHHFRTAVAEGTLIKCTLSKPSATDSSPDALKNVYLRPVILKSGPRIAFNYRYPTRDEAKNHTLPEAADRLEALLGHVLLQADLFTTTQEITLTFAQQGAAGRLKTRHTTTALPAPATTTHDRAKHRLLNPADAPWLHDLGIANAKAEILPTAQDKWRQINKFLEIIGGLLRAAPLPSAPRIADMGSGKGYLTFALYDYLTRHIGLQPHITGIELRPALVDFCQKTAEKHGFKGLDFQAADIETFQPERLDALIALHACDTATDLAIAAGLRQQAAMIVVVPCCHKQIRRELDTQNELAPLLRHGILAERQAELLTDGIRALLLEAQGYKTSVFEFISTEHTAKNVMITALRQSAPPLPARRAQLLAQVDALKVGFGIRTHFLETLLGDYSAFPIFYSNSHLQS
jgi:SAM-dependent methyltransferase